MTREQTSSPTLMWMLVASTLLFTLAIPGVVGGLLLACMVVFVVSSDPTCRSGSGTRLPLLLHLWALTVLVLRATDVLD